MTFADVALAVHAVAFLAIARIRLELHAQSKKTVIVCLCRFR